ncbi:MAG: hypothetical protein HY040_24880 [Planctomycetes bacterium]|nr:hypothetical protein [Planctomycetota bacterium]
MTTLFAAFLRPGSGWDPNKSAREQPFWDEHAQFMDAVFETRVIILGGPFADGTGSLVIVAAENAEQVREMYRDDPWTKEDVLLVHEVKEWTIFLDGRMSAGRK